MNTQTVSSKLFYMKQTISYACGTVALMHSVVKIKEKKFKRMNSWMIS